MQLHPFELYSLIELLDPALFPTFDDFDEHRQQLRGLNATVERFKRFAEIDEAERDEALTDAEMARPGGRRDRGSRPGAVRGPDRRATGKASPLPGDGPQPQERRRRVHAPHRGDLGG